MRWLRRPAADGNEDGNGGKPTNGGQLQQPAAAAAAAAKADTAVPRSGWMSVGPMVAGNEQRLYGDEVSWASSEGPNSEEHGSVIDFLPAKFQTRRIYFCHQKEFLLCSSIGTWLLGRFHL
jgi:hypothetical protein